MEGGQICVLVTHTYEAIADTIIASGGCNGANHMGTFQYLNVGVGRGLVRFQLDAAGVTALLTPGKVKKATLTLTRNANCESEVNPCPATAGSLQVFPLRNDWDEGNDQSYTGADWCRRLANKAPWNQPGADGDHGTAAGLVSTGAQDPALVVELDASKWDASWLNSAAPELSVLLIPVDALFVFASRESTQWAHPKLTLETCQ